MPDLLFNDRVLPLAGGDERFFDVVRSAHFGEDEAEALVAVGGGRTLHPNGIVMVTPVTRVVRSQMNIRLSFRVEEQRDVDLILGQGKLKAEWHAHKLNAPGKFLVWSPEHGTRDAAAHYALPVALRGAQGY